MPTINRVSNLSYLTCPAIGLFVLCFLGAANAYPEELRQKDGFLVHPYKWKVMRGFPPAKDRLVTPATSGQSREHLRWVLQHTCELAPIQPIPRGTSTTTLPRSPMPVNDFKALTIKVGHGKQMTVGEFLKEQSIDGLMVLHDGHVVNELYFHGMQPRTRHLLASAGKSLVATSLATLDLDHRKAIETYVPLFSKTSLQKATVRELFDMTSGVDFSYGTTGRKGFGEYAGTTFGLSEDGEPRSQWDHFLSLELVRPHGERMRYKDVDVQALMLAGERISKQRFADHFSEAIWAKLGTEYDAAVKCDSFSSAAPSYGIATTLRDLARWGQMCLQDGRFNGQQIVPKSFFEDLRKNGSKHKIDPVKYIDIPSGGTMPKGTGYRSFFWIPPHKDTVIANGGLGQLCYVNYQYQTVIVIFSTWQLEDDHKELLQAQWRACLEISRVVSMGDR